MREPRFWWHEPGIASALLAPFGALYGSAAASRMRGASQRANVPVICIGNFTLGGTGKTPAAIAVAELLKREGRKPALLTRGYGGSVSRPARGRSAAAYCGRGGRRGAAARAGGSNDRVA